MASMIKRCARQQRSRSLSTTRRKANDAFHRSKSSTLPSTNQCAAVTPANARQAVRGDGSKAGNEKDTNANTEICATPPKSPRSKPYRARGSRGRGGRRKKAQKAPAADISVASSTAEELPPENVKLDTSSTPVRDEIGSQAVDENLDSHQPSVVLIDSEQIHAGGETSSVKETTFSSETSVSTVKETVGYDYNPGLPRDRTFSSEMSLPGLQRSRTFSSEMSACSTVCVKETVGYDYNHGLHGSKSFTSEMPASTCVTVRAAMTHERNNSEDFDLKGLGFIDDGSPTNEDAPDVGHHEANRSRSFSSSSSFYDSRSRTSSYEYSNLRPDAVSFPPTASNVTPSDYGVLPPMPNARGVQQYESRFLAARDFPMENQYGDKTNGFDNANVDYHHPLRHSDSSECDQAKGHRRQRSFTDPSHDMEQKLMHEQRQHIHHNDAICHGHHYPSSVDSPLYAQLDANAHPFFGDPSNTNRARTLSDPLGGSNHHSRIKMDDIQKQREMMPEGGSLFKLSPRSFLLGKKDSFDFADV